MHILYEHLIITEQINTHTSTQMLGQIGAPSVSGSRCSAAMNSHGGAIIRNAMVNFMRALPRALPRIWVSGPNDSRGVAEAPSGRAKTAHSYYAPSVTSNAIYIAF